MSLCTELNARSGWARVARGKLCGTLPAALLIMVFITAAPAADARTRPEKMKVDPAALSSLDVTSTASWEVRKAELYRDWSRILGTPPALPPLDPHIVSTTHEHDHDRILLTYQTEPGIRTDAFLLIPHRRPDPAPAAVIFHATTSEHILQPVGLATSATRHLARHLVRRGYITLSPRCFIYGYADESATTVPATPPRRMSDYTTETERLLRRVPGWTGMGKMLRDGTRAVDYLLSRPDVDPRSIVSIGHSLGAKESLYLAAFDPRIAAAVASEGGVGLRHSNWDAVWYLGPQVREMAPSRDHHELLALIAPRGFLIAGGGDSDGEHTRPLVEAARPAWFRTGAPDSLVLMLHDKGHDFPPEIREAAFDWLDSVTGNSASPDETR